MKLSEFVIICGMALIGGSLLFLVVQELGWLPIFWGLLPW